jgi:hypothetical protein
MTSGTAPTSPSDGEIDALDLARDQPIGDVADPAPPYSSGMVEPSRPSAPISETMAQSA